MVKGVLTAVMAVLLLSQQPAPDEFRQSDLDDPGAPSQVQQDETPRGDALRDPEPLPEAPPPPESSRTQAQDAEEESAVTDDPETERDGPTKRIPAFWIILPEQS